jgi:hypothetical protein
MKVYYEAATAAPEEDGGEFVRLDVTDYTKEERAQILAALIDFMPKESIFTAHTCHHDVYAPCTSVEMKLG